MRKYKTFFIDATTFQLAEGEAEDIKDGLDNFFSKTTSSPASHRTPVGSPVVEDIKNSSPSSRAAMSRSREDLRMKVMLFPKFKLCVSLSVSTEFVFLVPTFLSQLCLTACSQVTGPPATGNISPLMFDPHGRKSPASEEMTGSRYSQAQVTKPRGGGGLSCLKPNTLDDDNEPLTKSPEKKPIMSPSGKSISDIFGKVSWLLSSLYIS